MLKRELHFFSPSGLCIGTSVGTLTQYDQNICHEVLPTPHRTTGCRNYYIEALREVCWNEMCQNETNS